MHNVYKIFSNWKTKSKQNQSQWPTTTIDHNALQSANIRVGTSLGNVKAQKYSIVDPREFVELSDLELTIENIKRKPVLDISDRAFELLWFAIFLRATKVPHAEQ